MEETMKIANSQQLIALLITLLLAVLLSGCYSSSQTTRFDDLEKAKEKEYPIRTLTVDSTLYTFDSFSFTDTTISGEGRKKRDNSIEEFKGTLNFSEIVFVERLKSNNWKAFWIIPMSAAVIGGVVQLTEPSELNIHRPVGSCPLVSSYNGSEFVMEAEVFSTAISKSFETQTFHLLPSLSAVENELRIRIGNERPETHLVNDVALYAVDALDYQSLVLDVDNAVWGLRKPQRPVRATDHSGAEVLETVSRKDGRFWKTNLNELSSNSDFRDRLVTEFELPPGVSQATLVVDALNSELITQVYQIAGAMVGENSLLFYRSLQQDQPLKDFFRHWIRKTSLTVELATEHGWKEIGAILPEANVIPFTRAIRLTNLEEAREPLRIRLSSLTDIWHIDAVSVDYSSKELLPTRPLELISAKASHNTMDVSKVIANTDSLYVTIMPSEYIDLTFEDTLTSNMQNPKYIVSAGGYFYEWFPKSEDQNKSGNLIPDWLKGMEGEEMLTLIRQQEKRWLWSIYSTWKKK